MKHHTLKLVALSLTIAALSACHQGGVGVDSTASQKAGTSAENALRIDRAIQSSTSAQASIQMPAAPLMTTLPSTPTCRRRQPPAAARWVVVCCAS